MPVFPRLLGSVCGHHWAMVVSPVWLADSYFLPYHMHREPGIDWNQSLMEGAIRGDYTVKGYGGRRGSQGWLF